MLVNEHRVLVPQDKKGSGEWLHRSVNVLTELDTYTLAQVVSFMSCVFYHN